MENFDVKRVLIVTASLTVAGSLVMLIGIPVVHVVRLQMADGVSCAIANPDGSLRVLYGAENCTDTPTPLRIDSL